MAKITIDLTDETARYLKLLDPSGPEATLAYLAGAAADGLRRPGAWERDWLWSAFPEAEVMARVQEKLDAGELTPNEWGQLVWKKS